MRALVTMKLLSLPNYLNGEYVISDEKKILKNYKGEDYAEIYGATDAQLRQAKRNLILLQETLRKIPLSKILSLIKKSMEYYLVVLVND